LSQAEPIARTSSLSFGYPAGLALDQIDLVLTRGAITALVGPNGAGKTTLMRLLAALETPHQGHVTIDGVDAARDPRAVHRRVGFLQDFFGLYDDLSVAEALTFHARARRLAGHGPAAWGWAVERLGLGAHLAKPARALSRGLRQRLAIAQAILHRPALLILDEPASGLDPDARDQLADLMRSLRDEGMSLLVSSHILAELDAYATEMIVLDRGRLVEHVALASVSRGLEIEIRLAMADDRLPGILADWPGLVLRDGASGSARVVLPDLPTAASDLLRHLVEAGLQVDRFAEAQGGLVHAYRRIAGRGEGRA
jgi:ABC-2 type transport system ATP-binding protein